MTKRLLLALLIFFSIQAFSQTPAGSFEYHTRGGTQSLTAIQVRAYISKINLENFRLSGQRTTLVFDNGFDIVLWSAAEAQQAGLISGAATYPASFSKEFKLPSFHMNDSGSVATGYSTFTKKYSAK